MDFKEMYKETVDGLRPSSELVNRIRSNKEVEMRVPNKKKMVVLALVACMLVGTTAFAASRITRYVGWSNPNSATVDYDETVKVAEEMGVAKDILQQFSNGYVFAMSNVGGTTGLDEKGKTVAEGETLEVTYTRENGPKINLYIDPMFETGDYSNATEAREINGVMVYYNKDFYKFVPADYKMTEEDQARMDEPHFYLSYGSSEVEEKISEGIVFETDNKIYNMFCWDANMTPDEWCAMAEELLQ